MKKQKNQPGLWEAVAADLIYLTACAVNGETPKAERVEKMDLQRVYALSKSQSLEAITYFALERLKKAKSDFVLPVPEQVLRAWKGCAAAVAVMAFLCAVVWSSTADVASSNESAPAIPLTPR